MTMRLRLIGYWKTGPGDTRGLPDPHDFVDPTVESALQTTRSVVVRVCSVPSEAPWKKGRRSPSLAHPDQSSIASMPSSASSATPRRMCSISCGSGGVQPCTSSTTRSGSVVR